jgi:diguanylate cyclase (GGDEF)-like protein
MASQSPQKYKGRSSGTAPKTSARIRHDTALHVDSHRETSPEHSVDVWSEIELLKLDKERLQRQLAAASRQVVEAHRLANQDGLTGLPNRRLLIKRLQWAVANARQRQRRLALLFIDLDGFKNVNDRFGHAIGDKLLTFVAARIATCVRSDDIACRYGGDEFVVLLSNISEVAIAVRIADMIAGRIGRRFQIAGIEIQISASVGLATYPDDGDSYDALLRQADAAMYRSKITRRKFASIASIAH